jgi:hypothetical protein
VEYSKENQRLARELEVRRTAGEDIRRHPVSLTSLECQVSKLVNSDACPCPTTHGVMSRSGSSRTEISYTRPPLLRCIHRVGFGPQETARTRANLLRDKLELQAQVRPAATACSSFFFKKMRRGPCYEDPSHVAMGGHGCGRTR